MGQASKAMRVWGWVVGCVIQYNSPATLNTRGLLALPKWGIFLPNVKTLTLHPRALNLTLTGIPWGGGGGSWFRGHWV